MLQLLDLQQVSIFRSRWLLLRRPPVDAMAASTLSMEGCIMSRRALSILFAAWLISLIAVAAIAQSRAIAPLSEPVTLRGDDIAFRVEGTQGSAPVGRLIVRYNGRWVEPRSAPEAVRLAAR
jgi:hypothetical protein